MGLRLNSVIIFLLLHVFLICFVVPSSFADYGEPHVVLEGSWGEEVTQFGLLPEDTFDSFPKTIKVNVFGKIFVADEVNKRVKIYLQDGKLFSVINPVNIAIKYSWPSILACDNNDNAYTSNYDNIFQKYGKKGDLLWTKDIRVTLIEDQNDEGLLIYGMLPRDDKFRYFKMLFDGSIQQKYLKPHFSIVEKKQGQEKFRTVVTYSDIEYSIGGKKQEEYKRGCNDVLFGLSRKEVSVFNNLGILIHKLVLPEDNIKQIAPGGPGGDARYDFIEEYGKPVVSPLGDIYCWKRTPETYSILRWTWRDKQDSPVELKAISTIKTITLSWKKPEADFYNIKEYEIARATELCGSFELVGTQKKDNFRYVDKKVKSGETYYYKIRAINEDGSQSGFSNKVAIRIQSSFN